MATSFEKNHEIDYFGVNFNISTSPTKKLGLPFLAVAPNIDESPILNESAQALVMRLSHEKANALSVQYPQHLVIGSDQVCVIGNKIMGKPHNFDNAFQQLKSASGNKVTFILAYVC